MDNDARDDQPARREDLDPGAFIGRQPELASGTLPGGVQRDDVRVAANASQPGMAGLDELDESASEGEGRDR